MNPFDQLAIAMDTQRAMNIDHRARCRCGDARLVHQFDANHEGTCTRKGCTCREFRQR